MSCCVSLAALPDNFGGLTSLIVLNLTGCTSLRSLPASISQLGPSFRKLDLTRCSALVELPASIGGLAKCYRMPDDAALEQPWTWAEGDAEWNKNPVAETSQRRLVGATELVLRACSALVALPESIGQLVTLTDLNLGGPYGGGCNALTALPESIGQLKLLRFLTLRNCKSLTRLPDTIGDLCSLAMLHLEHTSLTALPDSIGNLKSLNCLLLRHCTSLIALPNTIGQLKALVELDLEQCCSMTVLPTTLVDGPHLQLNLRGCTGLEVTSRPTLKLLSYHDCSNEESDEKDGRRHECIFSFQRKSALSQAHNYSNNQGRVNRQLCNWEDSVVDSWQNYSAPVHRLDAQELSDDGTLTGLDLSNMPWIALPTEVAAGLGALSSLVKLDLHGCQSLTALPESIGELVALVELDLSHCEALSALPASLGGLKRLSKIILNCCGSLTALPSSVATLPLFTELSLGDMHWKAIPAGIAQHFGHLKQLSHLSLCGCVSLKALPDSIGKLHRLAALDLKSCAALELLPSTVGQLTALDVLDARGCGSLVTLPSSISGLVSLTALRMGDEFSLIPSVDDYGGCRSLAVLPDGIADLKALRDVSLQGCSSLKTLPDGLQQLDALSTLNVAYCAQLVGQESLLQQLKANGVVVSGWSGPVSFSTGGRLYQTASHGKVPPR